MILPLFRRGSRGPDTISTLYGTIVAQARLPCFYQNYGVPDTVNGRFDLIVLHLAVVLDRLMPDPMLSELGQRLFDHFCDDMDNNLREMGVGDLTVPKRMRQLGEAFYGRSKAYRTALEAKGDALATALSRNVYADMPTDADAPRRLAAYIQEAIRDLATETAERLAIGQLRFPDPARNFKIAE